MPEKVLIVEDETALRETLTYTLEREGFSVRAVEDGPKALPAALDQNPDIILLDLMLPGIDGFEVCRRLRAKLNVPILMLTARESEIDRVVGLEMGADDYITKPFHMRELIARIRAQLRRVRMVREEKGGRRRGGGSSAGAPHERGSCHRHHSRGSIARWETPCPQTEGI